MQTLSILQAEEAHGSVVVCSTLLTPLATYAWWLLENSNKPGSEEPDLSPNLVRAVQTGKSLILTALVYSSIKGN